MFMGSSLSPFSAERRTLTSLEEGRHLEGESLAPWAILGGWF